MKTNNSHDWEHEFDSKKKSIIEVFNRMKYVKIESMDGGSMKLSHQVEDWPFIQSVARNYSMHSERWMQNQEPRTTIHFG